MKVQEPFDAGRAAIVVVLGLALVAGLELAEVCRRLVGAQR